MLEPLFWLNLNTVGAQRPLFTSNNTLVFILKGDDRMNYLTTEDVKPIKDTNPLPIKEVDSTGAEKFTAANPGNVQLSGSNITQAPETGAKTVTSTAAELFTGSAALDGRNKLIVYNEGSGNVYWGKGTVTTTTGFPLLPGDSIIFSFKPDIDTPIFFVAESDTLVRVGELA